MKYVDKNGKPIAGKEKDRFLSYVYSHRFTRVMLKPMTYPWFSKLGGKVLSSRVSKAFIPHFEKKNHIDLSEYEKTKYRCFNDFFSRKILSEKRPVCDEEDAFVSPCDGRLTAYHIDENLRLKIKDSVYSVESLIRDSQLAKDFLGGCCVIIRLCVDNYHRYHFPCDGHLISEKTIPGFFNSVRPSAINQFPVFKENSRTVSFLDSPKTGPFAQIEVGALLVGKIVNNQVDVFRKGEEKGHFLYGGSTIVLLIPKDGPRIDKRFFTNTDNNCETKICMGECIGRTR